MIVWVSSVKMTFLVTLDDRGIITETAPIGRSFVGQPFDNLRRWLRRQGGYEGKVIA